MAFVQKRACHQAIQLYTSQRAVIERLLVNMILQLFTLLNGSYIHVHVCPIINSRLALWIVTKLGRMICLQFDIIIGFMFTSRYGANIWLTCKFRSRLTLFTLYLCLPG